MKFEQVAKLKPGDIIAGRKEFRRYISIILTEPKYREDAYTGKGFTFIVFNLRAPIFDNKISNYFHLYKGNYEFFDKLEV